MLTASRSLFLSAGSGDPLPKVDFLSDLYKIDCVPRHGQVIFVVGRSGSQKSGFAMYWTLKMGLPTLYWAADQGTFTTAARITSAVMGKPVSTVEASLLSSVAVDEIDEALANDAGHMSFAFGSPITHNGLVAELEAYVEIHNRFPEVLVIDSLIDMDGCAHGGYSEHNEAMSYLMNLARNLGITVIICHHASDVKWEAKTDPYFPPGRDQIKFGLSERPELSLSVALNPKDLDFYVAVIKQRMGPSDPTARMHVTLKSDPNLNRFERL